MTQLEFWQKLLYCNCYLNNTPNIEAKGISLIASGNIGEQNNKLTFHQTDNTGNYAMDMLAKGGINVKGMNNDNTFTKVCTLIARGENGLPGNID